MLDHILEHLDPAEGYDVNAARLEVLKTRSKRLLDLS